jgi:hypothetical protein
MRGEPHRGIPTNADPSDYDVTPAELTSPAESAQALEKRQRQAEPWQSLTLFLSVALIGWGIYAGLRWFSIVPDLPSTVSPDIEVAAMSAAGVLLMITSSLWYSPASVDG